MPITANGPAPYAPPGSVISVIAHHRDRGLPTPVTTGIVARVLDSGEALASRVMTTLRLLDLVDKEGNIQPAFDEMARATSQEDFLARFADVVRAAYADVLHYIDPATADIQRIEGQFRNYTPRGQVARQAALFRGLCVFTRIIPRDEGQPVKAAPVRTKAVVKPPQGGKVKQSSRPAPVVTPAPAAQTPSTDAKSRYIDLLLKQASENPSDELFNRIEKVLGLSDPIPADPTRGGDD